MQQKKLKLEWKEFKKKSKLPKNERLLLALAVDSLDNAYAPYSNFKVGASILLANGKMVGGSNQENAAYPMCLCAERVALSAAASEHPNVLIKSMAITGPIYIFKSAKDILPFSFDASFL